MNINDDDQEFKNLLKKGNMKITSADFSDEVMGKIYSAAEQQPKLSKNLRLAWIFIGLTILLIPFVFIIVINNIQVYSSYINRELLDILVSLFPVLISFFVIVIIMQLDGLIRLTMNNLKYNL